MDKIKFQVYDEDVTTNTFVGGTEISVFNIIGPRNGQDQWYDILYEKKLVGKIRL